MFQTVCKQCNSLLVCLKQQKLTFPLRSKHYFDLVGSRDLMSKRNVPNRPRIIRNNFTICHRNSQMVFNREELLHCPKSSTLDFGRGYNTLTEINLPLLDFTTMLKGPKANFTVSIEGNIGSGKSTLLNHFSKFTDVQVLHEPVEKWRDVRGYNLLDLMYKDPCRWAHTFQTYVQMTMLELHLKACTVPVKLIERSLFSARYCFVENLYRSKMVSAPEYAVYCEWYKMITKNLDVGLDLIVYLRTEPSNLHERIKKRSRSEEKTIPLQYLEDLHNLHEEWLMEKKHGLTTPVLVLDANDNLCNMYKKFEEHTSDILCRKLKKPQNEEENFTHTGEESVPSSSQIVATATN
ncbi:deoxynucleoside kinase-like [Palaemon carinicauda]|uniref:deoxynucleoside kinase-like n=1 Tax=Palaemon carinicauda TaxID=392227 RepID=UPI0035B60B19